MTTTALYHQHLARTGDVRAAATLALADTLKRDPDRSLSVTEAAEFLGVSPRTVHDLAASGQLRHHRIGTGRGRVLFNRADLEAFRERSTVTSRVNRLAEHIQ